MSKLMLIDAVHPEETRVAISADGRVDDFDFEAAGKQQLRGNIYLAKVTRVEPSLQAAFVDYGGNRHGFLAFSEIHPDYYQLPKEDRDALLQEEAERAAEAAAEDDDDELVDIDEDDDEDSDDEDDAITAEADDPAEEGDEDEDADDNASDTKAESTISKRRRSHPSRRYKIQEVIRRRQVMLVQVVKEERGNKGAALTTYLSLAGRYCVLMPNTPRGGGISRKISSSSDRKRLRNIMQGLDVPTGMGLIVRTAGAKRTKTDIKRDFDYLQKLWDKIRDLTLKSMAPTLINEEGGLVHRAMRDLYDKDIDEVLIQGETAYREAKDLAKLLMPSQSRKVKQWKDQAPVFVAKNIEDQLNSIFSPIVHLKSGGYLVINQTEALVAIDVNSGKSTRGRNIEQTATQTNLEAAEEACRQMRLRDLAGLIVIDFIDMDENKNNRAVEKRLKDCLKLDRARVQHGRISQFGLMEISRQRRRTGVLESSSVPCASCKGTGRQRSIESAALQLLRAIEARAAGGGLLSLSVSAPGEVALYLLNNKREAFTAIEDEAGIGVSIMSSEDLLPGEFSIDVKKDPSKKRRGRKSAPIVEGDPDDEEFAAQFQDDETDESDLIEEDDTSEEEDQARGRRGRGRRRRSSKRSDAPSVEADADSEVDEDADIEAASDEDGDEEEPRRKRRRRGRRGGRRRRRDGAVSDTALEAAAATEAALALPPIDSKRPVGKDLPPEDGGALLDGLSVTINEILDIDLQETRDVSRPETPGDAPNDDEESAERPKSSRRRRSRSKSRRSDRPERSESAAPDAAEGHGEVLVKALPPTDPSMEDAPAEEVPAPEAPVVANEAASEASPPEPEAPQVEPTASEVPEPVAVETPAEPEIKVEGSEKSEKPKRRGWWLRRKTG